MGNMTVYSFTELQQKISMLLETALREGQIKFKNADGRIFVIRPERPQKKSPFDVQSINLAITRNDIIQAIRESRARY
jgi:hypothetical protein